MVAPNQLRQVYTASSYSWFSYEIKKSSTYYQQRALFGTVYKLKKQGCFLDMTRKGSNLFEIIEENKNDAKKMCSKSTSHIKLLDFNMNECIL